MTRVARPSLPVGLLVLLLAACASPPPPPTLTTDQARQDQITRACREESTRVVLFRDRGQQMRIDEGANSVGTQANIPTLRAETDRLAQTFERDRMAQDCVRLNSGAATPTPAPATAPAAPPASTRRR